MICKWFCSCFKYLFHSKGDGRGYHISSPNTPKAPKHGPRPPSRLKCTEMKQIAAVLFQEPSFPSRCLVPSVLSKPLCKNRVLFYEDELCQAVAQNKLRWAYYPESTLSSLMVIRACICIYRSFPPLSLRSCNYLVWYCSSCWDPHPLVKGRGSFVVYVGVSFFAPERSLASNNRSLSVLVLCIVSICLRRYPCSACEITVNLKSSICF